MRNTFEICTRARTIMLPTFWSSERLRPVNSCSSKQQSERDLSTILKMVHTMASALFAATGASP
jgi:hypothetical protein